MTHTIEDMQQVWKFLPENRKRTTDCHQVLIDRAGARVWVQLSKTSVAEFSILRAVASAMESHAKQATKKRLARGTK